MSLKGERNITGKLCLILTMLSGSLILVSGLLVLQSAFMAPPPMGVPAETLIKAGILYLALSVIIAAGIAIGGIVGYVHNQLKAGGSLSIIFSMIGALMGGMLTGITIINGVGFLFGFSGGALMLASKKKRPL